MIKSLDQIIKKAEALFIEKQKEFPLLYKEDFKDLYISFYVEGYFSGSSDSHVNIFDNLDKTLVDNNRLSNNEKAQ